MIYLLGKFTKMPWQSFDSILKVMHYITFPIHNQWEKMHTSQVDVNISLLYNPLNAV